MDVSGQQMTSRPLYLRGKNPGTCETRGWMGPGAGMDVMEKRKVSCRCRDKPKLNFIKLKKKAHLTKITL